MGKGAKRPAGRNEIVDGVAGGAPGGAAAFEARYSDLYGEAWPGLREALLGPNLPRDFRPWPEGEAYRLDAASILAAEALELPEEGELLDACAAPGGKSLVLASRMFDRPGLSLLSNELSSDRRRRLVEVLDRHLPPELRRRVRVSGEDAAAMCRRNECRFGAILLDAPCSSERHVLADPAALAAWTASRPRALARRQWALLSAAFLMLKPGGCLVYSTCALEPAENEGVARRLDERYPGRLVYEPVEPAPPGALPKEPGLLVRPDLAGGAGPMYVCRIRKLS